MVTFVTCSLAKASSKGIWLSVELKYVIYGHLLFPMLPYVAYTNLKNKEAQKMTPETIHELQRIYGKDNVNLDFDDYTAYTLTIRLEVKAKISFGELMVLISLTNENPVKINISAENNASENPILTIRFSNVRWMTA